MQKNVEKVIDYIQKYTDDDGWVFITLNTVKSLTGLTNSKTASEIVETLKTVPELEFKKETKDVGRPSNKFRWQNVKVIVNSKEKTVSCKTKAFTDTELVYIKSKLSTENAEEVTEQALKIMNALALLGAKEDYIVDCHRKIADLLVLPATKARMYLDDVLKPVGLILAKAPKEPFNLKIILDEKAYFQEEEFNASRKEVETVIQTKPKETVVAPVKEVKVLEPIPEKLKENVVIKPQSLNVVVNSSDEEEKIQAMQALSTNIKDFQNFSENFLHFFKQTSQFILEGQDTSANKVLQEENLKLQEQLSQGNNATSKIIEDNNMKSTIITKLNSQIEENKKLILAYKTAIEKRNDYTKTRLEQCIGDIMSTIVEYTATPSWKRTNVVDNKLRIDIVDAISIAVNDIASFSTCDKE